MLLPLFVVAAAELSRRLKIFYLSKGRWISAAGVATVAFVPQTYWNETFFDPDHTRMAFYWSRHYGISEILKLKLRCSNFTSNQSQLFE